MCPLLDPLLSAAASSDAVPIPCTACAAGNAHPTPGGGRSSPHPGPTARVEHEAGGKAP